MYIPASNQFPDKTEILEFMRKFSFATIITIKENLPIATHLPFIINQETEDIILISHFAKANEQWQYIENSQSLVIFSEPHAYISPSNYEQALNVPTWNYIAIHAYGQGKLIQETEKVLSLLEKTIDFYEENYRQQWNQLPSEYKLKMSRGIVAFEIRVTNLQAKKKLSQNRSETEQRNIFDTLSTSKDSNEKIIAEYMKPNISKRPSHVELNINNNQD